MLWSFTHASISQFLDHFFPLLLPVADLPPRIIPVRNYGSPLSNLHPTNRTLTRRTPVRPEFTGTLAIKSGRHPVLEVVQPAGSLVANDVYCDGSSSFQIIQGPKCVLHPPSILSPYIHSPIMDRQHVRQKHLPPPTRPAHRNGHDRVLRPH